MVKLDLNSKDSDKAKEKIIDFDRNNITILDIDKLEEIKQEREEKRYTNLVNEATDKVEKAQKEFDDKKKEVNSKLTDAENKIKEAEDKINS